MRFPFIFIIIFICVNLHAQIDDKGNPIFISEGLSEEKIDGFELGAFYYNIKDNISNKKSSVFVSESPTKTDYSKFARELPSYYFLVHQDRVVKYTMMPIQKAKNGQMNYFYFIMNISTGENLELPCSVTGAISEKRAEELIELKIDSTAEVYKNNDMKVFAFDNSNYKVQDYQALKAEVIKLAGELINGKHQIKKPTTQKEIIAYIKKESKGGKLDFLSSLSGKLVVIDNMAYAAEDYTVFLWGAAVSELGLKDEGDAVDLWEEIYGLSLSLNQEKLLLAGFRSKEKD